MGRWRGGRCRWGGCWLPLMWSVLGIAMVLMAIDAASVKKKKMKKKTYLLSRLRIDMQRLAMAVAAVMVNAGGWWPACSGRRRHGWSYIATGDVDEKVLQRERAGLSCSECCNRQIIECVATNVRGGVATDGRGSVATNGRREGVATNSRIGEVLQRMGGRCCNERERQDGKDATGRCNISRWMDYCE